MDQETQRNIARAKVIMTLFETDAWKNLQDILANTRTGLVEDLVRADTWEKSCYLKGQIAELERIQYLEDYFANSIDLAESEATQDASE